MPTDRRVDPRTRGNPIVLVQSDSETWLTDGYTLKIKQGIVDQVSADTTSAVVFAKDASSAAASDIIHRDVRSGINTVLWSEPFTVSKMYIRSLVAGRVILTLE